MQVNLLSAALSTIGIIFLLLAVATIPPHTASQSERNISTVFQYCMGLAGSAFLLLSFYIYQ